MQVLGPEQPSITLNNKPIEDVKTFQYLGSVISHDGDTEADINRRIGKGAGTFKRLSPIWKSSSISTSLKIKLYNSLILPMVLYASETWHMSTKDES